MIENLVWVWGVLALLFLIAEIFTAGFFLVCFGIGALAAALVAGLGFDWVWQLVTFTAVSAIALIFLRPMASRLGRGTPNPGGIDRVVGKRAVVLQDIDPKQAIGMVRVDREEWRAESVDGQPIPKDATVEVVRVEGTRLIVRTK
jgi:inner membrane protein